MSIFILLSLLTAVAFSYLPLAILDSIQFFNNHLLVILPKKGIKLASHTAVLSYNLTFLSFISKFHSDKHSFTIDFNYSKSKLACVEGDKRYKDCFSEQITKNCSLNSGYLVFVKFYLKDGDHGSS